MHRRNSIFAEQFARMESLVSLLFVLLLFVCAPFSWAKKSFWTLTIDQQAQLLPELKPVFDALRGEQKHYHTALRAAQAVAAEYPASSTASLFARYYAAYAGNALAYSVSPMGYRGKREADPHDLARLKASLQALLHTIDSSHSSESGCLVSELRQRVLYDISWYDLQLGEYEKAIQGFLGILNDNPNSDFFVRLALHNLEVAYTRRGDAPLTVLSRIESLAETYSDSPVVRSHAYFLCAMTEYERTKDKDKALEYCSRAIRSTTDQKMIRRIERYISSVLQRSRKND